MHGREFDPAGAHNAVFGPVAVVDIKVEQPDSAHSRGHRLMGGQWRGRTGSRIPSAFETRGVMSRGRAQAEGRFTGASQLQAFGAPWPRGGHDRQCRCGNGVVAVKIERERQADKYSGACARSNWSGVAVGSSTQRRSRARWDTLTTPPSA